jgi:hypothetical protein
MALHNVKTIIRKVRVLYFLKICYRLTCEVLEEVTMKIAVLCDDYASSHHISQ